MIIDKLIQLDNSGGLRLLKTLIELNTYTTFSDLRMINKRNPNDVRKDLNNFIKLGLVITREGKAQERYKRLHYKINKSNKLVKVLKHETIR